MCTDPREQFREPERLGDVVVRTGVEPDDDVCFLLARGENDDRGRRRAGTELAAQVDAVGVGETEVEKHQVGHEARLNAVRAVAPSAASVTV